MLKFNKYIILGVDVNNSNLVNLGIDMFLLLWGFYII